MNNETKKIKLETEIEVCEWFMKCFDIKVDSYIGNDVSENIKRCKKELSQLDNQNEKIAKHIGSYFGLPAEDILKVLELKDWEK